MVERVTQKRTSFVSQYKSVSQVTKVTKLEAPTGAAVKRDLAAY